MPVSVGKLLVPSWGTVGAVSDNGWVTSDLFLQWLEHFIAFVKLTKEHKMLVDGHVRHKTAVG